MLSLFLPCIVFVFSSQGPCVVASCLPCIVVIQSFLALLLFILTLCCSFLPCVVVFTLYCYFHLALVLLVPALHCALSFYYCSLSPCITTTCLGCCCSPWVACLVFLLLTVGCCCSPYVVAAHLGLLLFTLCCFCLSCVDATCWGTHLTLLNVVVGFLPYITTIPLVLFLFGVLYFRCPALAMCELAWSTWNTRLGKEKRGRFYLFFNLIILLCFHFYLFINVFGFF
jgi:hypothetical protein